MSAEDIVLSVLKKQNKLITISAVQAEIYAKYRKNYSFSYTKSILFELLAKGKVEFKDLGGTKGMMFGIKVKKSE